MGNLYVNFLISSSHLGNLCGQQLFSALLTYEETHMRILGFKTAGPTLRSDTG